MRRSVTGHLFYVINMVVWYTRVFKSEEKMVFITFLIGVTIAWIVENTHLAIVMVTGAAALSSASGVLVILRVIRKHRKHHKI